MGRRLTAAEVASDDDGGGGKLKSSWPEAVGKNMFVAVAIIKAQRQDVTFNVLAAGEPQPQEYNAHRVCLVLNDHLIVLRTPFIG